MAAVVAVGFNGVSTFDFDVSCRLVELSGGEGYGGHRVPTGIGTSVIPHMNLSYLVIARTLTGKGGWKS